MKHFFLISVLAGVTALAGAADFSRLAAGGIAMRGAIAAGDADKLRQLSTHETTLLRVNSDGGDPQAAMQLGRLIRQRQFDLAIDTICAGNCALYVFPAARHKTIPAGAALALQASAWQRAQAGRSQMRRALFEAGVAEEDIERESGALAARLGSVAALEAAFAAQLGIAPAFYRDFQQVAALGEPLRERFPDQDAVLSWWPDAERLQRCYGIAGVDDGTRAARLAPDGYLYVPALSALVMGDQGLRGCP